MTLARARTRTARSRRSRAPMQSESYFTYKFTQLESLRTYLYKSIPKPPIPPPPGIPRAFDSRLALYSGAFDEKLRPPGRAFDHRKNVSQRSYAKSFVLVSWSMTSIHSLQHECTQNSHHSTIPPLFLFYTISFFLCQKRFFLTCYQYSKPFTRNICYQSLTFFEALASGAFDLACEQRASVPPLRPRSCARFARLTPLGSLLADYIWPCNLPT